ncbi:dUTP diphosphatase [bacterium]|nr:dUTP diphosphatase [bacterium]
MQIEVKIHPHGEGLPLPQYASPGAAGLDLYAAVEDAIVLKPHRTMAVPTGISIAIPEGFEGQVRPRSGMALKSSIGVINSPGTIDSDYRGEVKVLLTNFSDQDYSIQRGDRIAQLVIARYERIDWKECDELPESRRGSGGFGHSGK